MIFTFQRFQHSNNKTFHNVFKNGKKTRKNQYKTELVLGNPAHFCKPGFLPRRSRDSPGFRDFRKTSF